jgi:hypothetical protein
MRHRPDDRYLPVRIFGYPVHGRGGPHREYGYIYDPKLYDHAEGAQLAGAQAWGNQPFSIAHIRDGVIVGLVDRDEPRELMPGELAEHTAHLQWVWKED